MAEAAAPAPGPGPAELALHMQATADGWLQSRGMTGWSFAVYATDGDRPGAGTVISIRAGRYAETNHDALDPDEQAAYDERARIRDAIVEHFAPSPEKPIGFDVDDLVDDIVAALGGE